MLTVIWYIETEFVKLDNSLTYYVLQLRSILEGWEIHKNWFELNSNLVQIKSSNDNI